MNNYNDTSNDAYVDAYKNAYRQGYFAASRNKAGKNLVKTLRQMLWLALEAAFVLSIFKGCFG